MERMRQRREARRKKPLSALYHRIGKARAIWYCAGCVLLITLSVALPLSLSAGWRIGGLIAGFVVLYLVNNWYVASRWRCPACGERLPCIVGRSALRPKWVETCPRCDYGDS
ncbi:hypothetical protein LJC34_04990 [Oscillospiraceae bacterium OttesenSCG-928-G22]|nr:hypothetical protein [Oscillospiraceae bacterium OttesenSCG-928-G22]